MKGERLINFRPVVIVGLCLILGIFTAYLAKVFSIWAFLICLFIVLVVSALFYFKRKTLSSIVLSLFCLAFLLFGFTVLSVKIDKFLGYKVYDGATLTLTGTVKTSEIKDGENIIRLIDVKNGEKSFSNVYLKTADLSIKRGDRISFTDKIYYKEFTSHNLVYNESFNVYTDHVFVNYENALVFDKIFNSINGAIKSNLKGDSAVLLSGILLGDDSGFSDEVLNGYSFAGVSHIFSVSGLHFVFFSVLLSGLFNLLKIKGLKQSVLNLVLSILYAGVCAFPASAIRSVIMTSTLSFSKNLGRKYDLLNSIFLSAIIVLLIMPAQLLSPGFLLSYLAVLGICLFSKGFKKLLSFLPDFLSDSVSISLAATVTTIPIISQMSGYTSIISVFLNLIIIPYTSVLYSVSFVSVLISTLLPFMEFLLFIPGVMAYGVNFFITLLNYDLFLVKGAMSVFASVLYYLILAISNDKVNLKSNLKLGGALSLIATFALSVGGII